MGSSPFFAATRTNGTNMRRAAAVHLRSTGMRLRHVRIDQRATCRATPSVSKLPMLPPIAAKNVLLPSFAPAPRT